MPMDQVAELARQVANDGGVLQALQQDPTRITKPLNLSEPQLRALISAGSFSTVRPVMTTSVPVHSLANQIATMDVESLFPPEGQGEFSPGELPPPTAAAPHSVPSASPIAGAPPRPAAPTPSAGQAPHSGAPTAAAPQASTAPAAHSAPGAGFTPAAPVTSTGTPQTGTTPLPGDGQTSSSDGGQGSSQQTGSASNQPPGTGQTGDFGQQTGSMLGQAVPTSGQYAGQTLQLFRAPSAGVTAPSCCGASHIATIAIVAQLSTTAQAGITAITAIAGLG